MPKTTQKDHVISHAESSRTLYLPTPHIRFVDFDGDNGCMQPHNQNSNAIYLTMEPTKIKDYF